LLEIGYTQGSLHASICPGGFLLHNRLGLQIKYIN